MIPKPAVVTGLLLIVAAIALVTPWFRVTTSQVLPQTSIAYTLQFEVQTTGCQMETVYSLPNPVVTEYSQITVAPYTIIGGIASAAILVLLALVVVLCILFERGIITVSTKRRKKRKR